MAWFEPSLERAIDGPLAYADLLAELDAIAADPEASCALRIDGEFELVRARSVPRQHPPFRPLAEVVADQHVFELAGVAGHRRRLPLPRLRPRPRGRGLPPALHHRRPRTAAGTCSTAAPRRSRPSIDLSGDLHVELPPGVELDSAQLDAATASALDRVEHRG